MAKDWQIRGSTIYLGVVAIMLFGFLIPLGIEWLSPFFGVALFFRLKKQGRIKKFDLLEIGLMAAYTITLFAGLIYIQGWAFSKVPWYKLILVGIAADLFGTVLGSVPVFGDIASGILNFILVFTIIGGIQGAMMGFSIALISLIPGPTLGANTLFLIIFKIISELAFAGGGG